MEPPPTSDHPSAGRACGPASTPSPDPPQPDVQYRPVLERGAVAGAVMGAVAGVLYGPICIPLGAALGLLSGYAVAHLWRCMMALTPAETRNSPRLSGAIWGCAAGVACTFMIHVPLGFTLPPGPEHQGAAAISLVGGLMLGLLLGAVVGWSCGRGLARAEQAARGGRQKTP